ncbi:MAG: 23S rRNA (pseudouridine(1915)-N(3))-methyltransferase RlmH [Saprospiraceae bacterium]|nr:23S rRNA (pseudouridine(1915)-N(3))-methyltransferase RlmH [Saprospiraceae bacterium]MBP7699342.1 23S rRNA (pseudouridine(1915)-N(3))-methyltransferase RlmH [Saprospiraceae bacterium]
MKIELWVVGKTTFSYLDEGIELYAKRIKKYNPFDVVFIPDVKAANNTPVALLKIKEAENILKRLQPEDYLVVLDENGKAYSSTSFAIFLEKSFLRHDKKKIVFLVGGAFGFAEEIYTQAVAKLSLSPMTFSHQIIRLLFLEQLYRAFSIIHNEPYHNP